MLALLNRLLELSVRHRWLVLVLTLAAAGVGIFNATRLPIDAVPDITNVQVQILTATPGMASRGERRFPVSAPRPPWCGRDVST